jgi:nitric oxide dioxygenase
MTPDQIVLVEDTLASLDVDALAGDFYRRALADDEALSAMFTSDPAVQRVRFAAELTQIVRSIRTLDTFASTTLALGARHARYGVRAAHYGVMGAALLAALAAALGDAWTDEVEEAWTLAYNLTAETMMMGAAEQPLKS